MDRRQFLHGLGVGSLTVLAGCSGGDGGGGDGGGDATPTDGAADGEPSPTSTTAGAGSGGNGGTTTNGAGEPTTTADTGPATTTTARNESISTTASGSPSLPTLGEVSAVEPNHRFSMEISDFMGQGGQATIEGRFTGSNFALTVTSQGQSYQIYQVDGSAYFVGGGQCLSGMGSGTNFDAEEWASQHDYPAHLETLAEQRPTRTTTIDGETMYVYEGDPGVPRMDTVTYYVSAQTGYVRRVESEHVSAEFWDWGAVDDPVEAPC